MLGTVLKSCLAFSLLILVATTAAQAAIIHSSNAAVSVDRQALQRYPGTLPADQAAGSPEDTRTITLNFGPLHFQEVFRHPLDQVRPRAR